MTKYARIAAVTGGNKGIGFAIVRQLALQYPKSALNTGPLLIYLTARDQTRGEEALEASRKDSALKSVLSSGGGPVDVAYHQLDIADKKSIEGFAAHLKSQHPEGIDILVNNAGIAMTGFDNHVVENTLRVNYYGTLDAMDILMPLFKPEGGRLVNVSSMAGKIRNATEARRDLFRQTQTRAQVTEMMEQFKKNVADGTHEQEGWPSAAYATSKAGLTHVTRVMAPEVRKKYPGLLVNSCCPGWVDTDMTRGKGTLTPDEGASMPVQLALADIGGTYGEYWKDGVVEKW